MSHSTTWEAANQTRRRKTGSASPRRGSDRTTLEATLSRLSKAYTTSMECLGALHRADQVVVTVTTNKDDGAAVQEKQVIVQQVARVARRTLQTILVDPLVVPDAPSWAAGVQLNQQSSSTWTPRLPPLADHRRVLTSTEHQTTVRQIAYLALTNYADLLSAACLPPPRLANTSDSCLLDRGIVKPLQSLSQSNHQGAPTTSYWNDPPAGGNTQEEQGGQVPETAESLSQTLQCVVWALLDATQLDGSDPLVWLKLACASRRLAQVESDEGCRKYRSLERHALERGVVSRRHRVPSRLLVQAYEEWQKQQDEWWVGSWDVVHPAPGPHIRRLELPRYSWAVLGRILLRACRGESQAPVTAMAQFANLSLGMSPLLAMPLEAVVQPVVSYLDPHSYGQLKQVCRTLSLLRFKTTTRAAVIPPSAVATGAGEGVAPAQATVTKVTAPPTPAPQALAKTAKSVSTCSKESVQGSRVSKRLRSQIITSGKRAERSQRRSSVDYCVHAIVLGRPPPENPELPATPIEPDGKQGARIFSLVGGSATMPEKEHRRMEAVERLGPGSLISFVRVWTDRSTTPLSLLFSYVAHVSIYTDEVFSSDHHGTMVLLASVTDSLEVILKRTRSYQGFTPAWSTGDCQVPSGAFLQPDQVFALDLLHAELRFKRCDREDYRVTDFSCDSDANVVERLVHTLGPILNKISKTSVPTKQWSALKIRYQWLVAGYYLWRSRLSHDLAESREAEQEGLECIKELIALMSDLGIPIIKTPHLEGIGRSGEHWKELSISSLTSFQHKVQASSVVLKAQEQFLVAASGLSREEGELTEEQKSRFVAVSLNLMERYSSPPDSPDSNYFELIEDFVGVHGSELFVFSLENQAVALRNWFSSLTPTWSVDRDVLQSMTEPGILPILMTCIHLGEGESNSTLLLITSLICCLESLQRRFVAASKGTDREMADDSNADAMSDDLSLMSEDESPDTKGSSILPGYARLLGLFTEMLSRVLQTSDSVTRREFARSPDIIQTLERIFKFCLNQPLFTERLDDRDENDTDITGTVFVLDRTTELIRALELDLDGDLHTSPLETIRLSGLANILISQEDKLNLLLKAPAYQKDRPLWKSQIKALAYAIGYSCLNLGSLLSCHVAVVENGHIAPASRVSNSTFPTTRVCASLLSLYHISRTHYRDVPLHEKLRLPVITALIGFCGAAACANSTDESAVSLIDFVDSDESATEWMEDEDQEGVKYSRTLRVITQIVHCIQLTIGTVDERDMSKLVSYQSSDIGPLLPLVACRVLSFCSDTLIKEFRSEDSAGDLASMWLDYPVGTRKVGAVLDSLLHKVYHCLHGFTLSSTDSKESGTHAATETPETPLFLPEGVKAAAQLYRSVLRATAFGRKSPPKAALRTILLALPEEQDTSRAKKIRDFVYSGRADEFDSKSLRGILEKSSVWEKPFEALAELWGDQRGGLESSEDDESSLVRHGIAKIIAQGPLPQYQESPDSDVRAEAVAVESEIGRKFNAIIYGLCHGKISSCKGWVNAAQCAWQKSELIADRLGLQKRSVQCPNFFQEGPLPDVPDGIQMSELVEQQEQEDHLRLAGWTETLDAISLSVFVDHCWSSFDSLKECSRCIEKQLQKAENEEEIAETIQTYQEITRLFRNQQFGLWQQAWGGVFVSSLRVLARKCMAVAYFIASRENDHSVETRSGHFSEICGSLGIFMYSEVSGSQTYGYPMRTMTEKRKRDHAEVAAACFKQSLELEDEHKEKTSNERDSGNNASAWDILFMVGKCYEKIAGTYKTENLIRIDDTTDPVRQIHRVYEQHMQTALEAYSKSLEIGLQLQKAGDLVVDQQGGSGHGVTEVLYRLHATRLKCLISALLRNQSERGAAEMEALRLTELFWFTKIPADTSDDVRSRMWNVLTDVVDAMHQCRSEFSCFHRSVYRHAQALMWAPIVYDPSQPEGSFGTVPQSQAFKLRGFGSGGAVESAASIISGLFDRRRAQLCAAWLTQPSPVPFEQINLSFRKYDSLRGKYIAAYLECLELCHNKNDLETFWRWVASTLRDLPSYFYSTAGHDSGLGSDVRKNHTSESLVIPSRPVTFFHFLTDVKRRTNAAMSSVLLHEVQKLKMAGKVSENHLKQAYSCFLRLNCEVSHLRKLRRGAKPVVDALLAVYAKLIPAEEQRTKQETASGDWSGEAHFLRTITAALEKCRELFPSLSGSFLSSKKVTKKKRPAPANETQQVFRVSIPEGLSAGDTFLTEIVMGETKKRIRLTVPAGDATTLRFSLTVPGKKNEESTAKKSKTNQFGHPTTS